MGDVHYMNPTNADERIRRRAFRERERARRQAVRTEERARRREIWKAEAERREHNRIMRLAAGYERFTPRERVVVKVVGFVLVWGLGGLTVVGGYLYLGAMALTGLGYARQGVLWIYHAIGG